VPQNEDPQLQYSSYDPYFWDKARKWKEKGWHIALHGSTHKYISKKKGLVPINSYSEFAGVDIDIQRKKIQTGYSILCSQGLKPTLWCAPAHTFDRNTLNALKEFTDIRIVTDGIAYYPYNKYDFFWLPQQLWAFEYRKRGIWTICLHIDPISIDQINDHLEKIKRNAHLFVNSIEEIQKTYSRRKRNLFDIALKDLFFLKKFLREVKMGIRQR